MMIGAVVDALQKPDAGQVLRAMAEAFPDRIDPSLLAVVLGCEVSVVTAAVQALVDAGLVRLRTAADGAGAATSSVPGAGAHAASITEAGMAVATGEAADWPSAPDAVQRLEAGTLRQLLIRRLALDGVSNAQRVELRALLSRLPESSLIGAAPFWARHRVSEWGKLLRSLD